MILDRSNKMPLKPRNKNRCNRSNIKYYGSKKTLPVYFNFLKQKIDQIFSTSRLLSKPTIIQIEPTTKCNLNCSFCESQFWDRKGMEMNFSDFKKIIDQFPFLLHLDLQGIGEPLLCKDFYKMVEYCKSNRISVGTTTNATLLNKTNIKKIINSGLDILRISMDGATSETFESIRVGSNFNNVIENTKNFIKIRGSGKTPCINFLFTGSNKNIHELPQIVTLASNIGVDYIYAQDAVDYGEDDLQKRIGGGIQQNRERARRYKNETIVEANKLGMPVIFNDPNICKKIFTFCFITFDGYVTSCPCNPDPTKFNFGNVLTSNFNDIWNNPKYVSMRKNFRNGKIPEFCKSCTISSY